MKVIVTTEDARRAGPSNTECPVALALRRMGFRRLAVTRERVIFGDRAAELPEDARRFVDYWDARGGAGVLVAPFAFDLAPARQIGGAR